MFSDAGKIVTITGVVTFFIGLFMIVSDKTGLWNGFNWFGNLLFDFRIEKDNFRLYFPLGSSIVLSIVLSLILFLVNKFIR